MVLNLFLALISTVNLADSLVRQGYYQKAIVEYKRAVFYKEGDSLKLFDKMASVFYREGDYQKAAIYYGKIYSITGDSIARFDLYRTLYKNKQYGILGSVLSDARTTNDSLLLGLSLGRAMDYRRASLLLKGENYNVKFMNPYFNKYISYIIPGSGQIFAGHVKDGIVAMAINGAFAYYGYRLYKDRDFITAFLTIPLFLRFYMGNATSAWGFTIERNNRIIDNLENSTGIF